MESLFPHVKIADANYSCEEISQNVHGRAILALSMPALRLLLLCFLLLCFLLLCVLLLTLVITCPFDLLL